MEKKTRRIKQGEEIEVKQEKEKEEAKLTYKADDRQHHSHSLTLLAPLCKQKPIVQAHCLHSDHGSVYGGRRWVSCKRLAY